MGAPFEVCRKCAVNHIENCPDCLGFGWLGGERGRAPVVAQEAHDVADGKRGPGPSWTKCEVCGSDWGGYLPPEGAT